MQKELFDLFVSAMEASCHLHCLATPHDFRRLSAPHLPPVNEPPGSTAPMQMQKQQGEKERQQQQQQRPHDPCWLEQQPEQQQEQQQRMGQQQRQEPQRYLWPCPSAGASAAFDSLWESAVRDERRRLSIASAQDKAGRQRQQLLGGAEGSVHSMHVPVLFGR